MYTVSKYVGVLTLKTRYTRYCTVDIQKYRYTKYVLLKALPPVCMKYTA